MNNVTDLNEERRKRSEPPPGDVAAVRAAVRCMGYGTGVALMVNGVGAQLSAEEALALGDELIRAGRRASQEGQ